MPRAENTPSLSLDRRGFVGGMAACGLTGFTRQLLAENHPRATACVWINLVGGPSQLDTWDPKPDAPSEVRGPFASIPTSIPGTRVSELFPLLAGRLHQVSLLRGIHHHNLPTHESGWRELQTGECHPSNIKPTLGARMATSGLNGQPGWVVLPGPIQTDGLCLLDDGQSPGPLGQSHGPANDWMPSNDMCQLVDRAARRVEAGVRFVTINTAPTVFHRRTWDCHADGGSLPMTAAQTRELGLELDRALDLLLERLQQTGLLDSTLVVATGEMGRTPHLNRRGGRDHWSCAWTALVAGAGTPGGAILGKTDPLGGEPVDGPLPATGLHHLVAARLGIA